jgi:hypothetical protein
MGMRKVASAILLAVVLWSFPTPLGAWGFNGHRFITDRAIDLLPQELRPFFQKYRTTVVEHAIDPDTYRTMGFTEETPRHFMDMDAYGPFPFTAIPHDYKEAVARRGVDFVLKNGTLPWRAQEIYDKLRDAFRQLPTSAYARDDVKLFSAVLAHYTEDSFQPFHAAVNYDGQLTNQQGIHARFETELVDRYADKLQLKPPAATEIPNAREFVFATLTDSFQAVDAILAADRAAAQGRTAYDDQYFAQLFEKTRPILERRLTGAMSGVASLIMSAWVDAGKPPLPAEAPSRPPRPIRR